MSGNQPLIKAAKFRFEIAFEKIEIRISFPCTLSIIWSRGTNRIESKSKLELSPPNSKIAINETLSMITSLKYNENKQLFSEKKSIITVVINTSKGAKVAGVVNLELSEFVNSKLQCQTQKVALTKCPDSNACLFFQLKTTYIGETRESDNLSISSLEIDTGEDLNSNTLQQNTNKTIDPFVSDDISQERRHKYGSPNPSPKELGLQQTIDAQKTFEIDDFISALKTQLFVVESEKEALVERLRQEREKFENSEEFREKEFNTLKEKISALEMTLFEANKSHHQEMKEIREQLTDTERNNKILDNQINERRTAFQKLNETKNSLSIQLLSQKSVYEKKIESLQDELSNLNRLKDEIANENLNLKRICYEKNALEDELAPKYKDFQNQINLWNTINQIDGAEVLDKIREYDKIVKSFEMKTSSLERDLEKQIALNETHSRSNKEIQNHLQKLEASNQSLLSVKIEFEKQCLEQKSKIEELERVRFDLNINISILKEESSILQEMTDKNTRELQRLSSENLNLSAIVKEKDDLIHQLRSALVMAGERMHSSEVKLESNQSTVSDYQKELKEAKKELMRLVGERNSLEETVSDLEARLKESLVALNLQSSQINSMNEEIEEMLLRNTAERSKLNQSNLDLELRFEESITRIKELERDKSMIQNDLNSLYKDMATQKLFYESDLDLYKKEEENWNTKLQKMDEIKKELAQQIEISEEKDWKLREMKLLLRALENKLQEDSNKYQRDTSLLIAQREKESEVLMQKENRLILIEAEANNYKCLSDKLASVIEDNYKTIQEFREGKKVLLLDIKRKEAFINHLIEGFKICQSEGEESWLEYIKDFTHSGPELSELKIDNRNEGVLKIRKNEEKRSSTKENEEHVNYKEKYGALEESFHLMEAELARIRISQDKNEVENSLRLENQKQIHKLKELENHVLTLENELVRNKQKLGDLINSVMEHGGPVFADRICSVYL